MNDNKIPNDLANNELLISETSKSTALSPDKLLQVTIGASYKKVTNKPTKIFLSAITAGFFIAIAFSFYIGVTSNSGDFSPSLVKLIGGLMFSLGLNLVILCGGDLFTSSILAVTSNLKGLITKEKMLKSWSIVYIGNFVGALLFVFFMWMAKEHMMSGGKWGLAVLKVANHKLQHTFIQAFFLGILCNVMVCLAVWMSYAGKTATDKILIVLFPIAMFVVNGFEHCVANMFLIPMGIVINSFAGPEFFEILNICPDYYSDLTTFNFLIKNLIPVTLGNIVGGLIIGIYYSKLYSNK